ncbi:4-hydroxy-tetrahydrodipicolinate reductase [Halarchaeum solikamskense]|uniref:4-hydroxy-tetrahydrodipicolinate reductase n=1 Tax=Halarchaeum nitratireducens TaxID=489913 RepID=UPI001B3AE3BE|nr:4-hydroxy-tetrahydrodipicolinate reductase [Halarchaeum solikamskense]MBP2252296.1 4-hydroxy-tetrahydrodipicolinate reductase [Halarchaeum solikamskense]
MTPRLAVTGATGRMGKTVLAVARERGLDIAFAVNRDADGEHVEGVPVRPSAEFEALLDEERPDAVVDFTGPEATVAYAGACATYGVPLVTGTTGFSEADVAALEEAGTAVPILVGANFSRGVQALLDAVESAVADLPEYDVELLETHHNGKRDAPSGTAKVLLDRIEGAREGATERVHGREGEAPREAGEIGVHARRAGDVTGEHEVLLAGNHESLELTHRAGSRSVFAEGALDAAAWLAEQPADYYRFETIASQL